MESEKEKIINVSIEDILPNRFQPRLAFDEKELNELSNSILKYGVIQPIVLRRIGDKYEIVAGERRYKATVLAGLKTIPAIIKNTDDNTSAEIALLENLQRKNLTVIEEAQSFKKLLDRGFTQEEIANKLSISQSSIANKIRLLNLPRKVQDALLYNKISERHARSLLSLNDTESQLELLEKIINERLTVRQTEEEISKLLNKTVENDIPEDIMKFINNNESYSIKVPDVVEIKDDLEEKSVENNSTNNIENNTNINPFQVRFEDNIRKIDEQLKNQEISFYDNIINNSIFPSKDEKLEHFEEISSAKETESNTIDNVLNNDEKEIENIIKNSENSSIEEEKEIYIPNVISEIREFTKKYNSQKIEVRESNLEDKYQIIIEIKKDE